MIEVALQTRVHSLLFVAGKPLSVSELSKLLSISKDSVNQICSDLMASFNNEFSGVHLIKNQEGESLTYQLVSNPACSADVERLTKKEFSDELTKPSLETLSIIAYLGPVDKVRLDKIRGVNSSLILRNLKIRGLIDSEYDKNSGCEKFWVTMDFIKYLGLSSLSELPNYDIIRGDEKIHL